MEDRNVIRVEVRNIFRILRVYFTFYSNYYTFNPEKYKSCYEHLLVDLLNLGGPARNRMKPVKQVSHMLRAC